MAELEAPKIAWPCENQSDIFIVFILHVLRIIPNFIDFIHHFSANLLLLCRSKKDRLTLNYPISVTCEKCIISSQLSGDVKREDKVLMPIDGFVAVLDLFATIHEVFQNIRKLQTIKFPKLVDGLLNESVATIREKLSILYPEIYNSENKNGGDPVKFLVQVIERLNQLVSIYKKSVTDSFGNESVYLKDMDFVDKVFINKGYATANCTHCDKVSSESFSFIDHNIKIPLDDFGKDGKVEIDLDNFIADSYYNIGQKLVKLECKCGVEQAKSNDLTITNLGEIQIIELNRKNEFGSLVLGSDTKCKIPIVLQCICDHCFSNRVHQLYLIGMIVMHKNQSNDVYATYIRNSEYYTFGCTSCECCGYIYTEKKRR